MFIIFIFDLTITSLILVFSTNSTESLAHMKIMSMAGKIYPDSLCEFSLVLLRCDFSTTCIANRNHSLPPPTSLLGTQSQGTQKRKWMLEFCNASVLPEFMVSL